MDLKNFSYTIKLPTFLYRRVGECLALEPSRERYREHYCLVLARVVSHLRRRFREIAQADGDYREWFCSLSSVLLHQQLGNVYNDVIRDLVRWGIIWRSDSYLPGRSHGSDGKCKGFSLCHPYSGTLFGHLKALQEYYGSSGRGHMKRPKMNLVKVKVRGTCLRKRLFRYLESVKACQMEDDTVRLCHDEIAGHFRVDEAAARATVARLVAEGSMDRRTADRELEKVCRINRASEDTVSLYVKRDGYGRIHTNMTNIKKEIRRDCLRCDGGAVGSVDIKSSQGAFLSAILGRFAGLDALTANHEPFLERAVANLRWDDDARTLDEYGRYCALLRERRLYEFFAHELAQDMDIDREVGRDEAKKEFLVMLFAPVEVDWRRHPMRAAVRRVWEEHFPRLLMCIDELKRTSYASLAHLMQKVESSFVFDRVIPRVVAEVGCPFCTVHDSVIVPEDRVPEVKRIVEEELDRCGVPTVTAEEFALFHPADDVRRFNGSVFRERGAQIQMAVSVCGEFSSEDDYETVP